MQSLPNCEGGAQRYALTKRYVRRGTATELSGNFTVSLFFDALIRLGRERNRIQVNECIGLLSKVGPRFTSWRLAWPKAMAASSFHRLRMSAEDISKCMMVVEVRTRNPEPI